MATYIFHSVRCSGLAEVLDVWVEQRDQPLGFLPRIPVRLPTRPLPRPPHGPTTVRPGRPGRPAGRPGRPGGGPGGFGRAGQAIAMAVGAAALEKFWAWRWYAMGGLAAYVFIRCVNFFRQRQRTLRVDSVGPTAYVGENADGKEILSAYLLEMLKKEACLNLDVHSVSSSFVSYHENAGPAVAFFCVEHLHLKVANHVNCQAPFMKDVNLCLNRIQRMVLTSANQRDANRLNEIGNGVSFCGLSKAGQAIGLFINHKLGDCDCWDCCSDSIHEPVFVERSNDDLSYMAARRLSSSGTLLENVPGDPEFIIFTCDGICNVLQNLGLVQFAYQGVRNGMPLRPLCEMFLELIQSSSVKMAIILVQFKLPCDTPHQLHE